MKPLSIGIVTEKLAECRAFYERWFGFRVKHAADWYVHMHEPTSGSEIFLLAPAHPSQPPALQGAYAGQGVFLNWRVENVDAFYAKLAAGDVPIEMPPVTESWGERHFLVRDPAGVVVNVFQL